MLTRNGMSWNVNVLNLKIKEAKEESSVKVKKEEKQVKVVKAARVERI